MKLRSRKKAASASRYGGPAGTGRPARLRAAQCTPAPPRANKPPWTCFDLRLGAGAAISTFRVKKSSEQPKRHTTSSNRHAQDPAAQLPSKAAVGVAHRPPTVWSQAARWARWRLCSLRLRVSGLVSWAMRRSESGAMGVFSTGRCQQRIPLTVVLRHS
jgi:hypothetical protein